LQSTGFPELTIEAIAADANVGKATVYRWWPNKGALVVDAFASSAESALQFPDTGSLYKDMRLQMNQVVRVLCTRRGRIVAALLGAGQSDPELLQAFREGFLWPRRREAYKTLRRGIERGELPRNMDLDLVLDILYGAIYMRFLIRHDELSEDYVRDVCRLVLGGAAGNSQVRLRGSGRKALSRAGVTG
jgi:AcrR family transcriptional regulator